jgi:phage tail sheath gpL-like
MVAFNQIPTGLRVPFVAVEFDNSRAGQGPSVQPYTVLLLGQKLSSGTQDELTLKSLTSEGDAIQAFGRGSSLHLMAQKYFANNNITECKAMAIDDLGAGVKAVKKITVSAGTAQKDGIVYIYVGGQRVTASVSTGDDQDAIATAIGVAIDNDQNLPYSAALNVSNDNEVDLTAKHAGEIGNIDVRIDYQDGEVSQDEFTYTITDVTPGSGNPDVAEIVAALPENQFNVIAHPWLDAANLTIIENELADRFGPLRQNDGVAITAAVNNFAGLQALGNGRNSAHSSIVGIGSGVPNANYEYAAAIAAVVARFAQIDPARPFQTLAVRGLLAPTDAEQFILSERNILLSDGIATLRYDVDGTVRIERMITTYQRNEAGSPDESYLDVNTLLTLSFLRYDFRVSFASRYPRHKLADDGTRFGAGQPVMTPGIGKAFAISKFAQWEELGLVENLTQFKNDLIVERNAQNVNQLDFLLPPDLINQLRVAAAQIQFLL